MKTPHPIPYQGSKRNLADRILSYFPPEIGTLYEPFAGSAAVTILAAQQHRAHKFYLNDINRALIELWKAIITTPEELGKKYQILWRSQQGNERKFYDAIRSRFNKTSEPELLLYLLARCVKASVRYNYAGEFNQSPDNRRLGRKPSAMIWDIQTVSNLLRGKTKLSAKDYREVVALATKDDLVYMDPPYQGTVRSGGFRYFEDIKTEEFLETLHRLNTKGVSFILSYDGRTGEKNFGHAMPLSLKLEHIEIDAGRSSQATLLGRNHITYESIYLSPSLVQKLEKRKGVTRPLQKTCQASLFAS